MGKYLKIHWTIRFIIGLMLFISILLILNAGYGLVFYTSIKDNLDILGSIGESISIHMILAGLIIPILLIFSVYSIFKYKRWAVVIFTIFIGLPLVISSFGGISYILFGFYQIGFDAMMNDKLILSIISISLLFLTWFSIKANMELIRLYKNIKNIDNVDIQITQITKPKFYSLFFISMTPIIILAGFMIVFYNPVVPLDLPDGYFEMEGFDLDNPTYTDQKICKEFENEIGKYSEMTRYDDKNNTNTGVTIAKKAIMSLSNSKIILTSALASSIEYSSYQEYLNWLQKDVTSESYKKIRLSRKEETVKRVDLNIYIQDNSIQWKQDLNILRSELTDESVTNLQNIIRTLPDDYRCNIRNDDNIASEFFPSLIIYLKVSRLFTYAIQLAILENDQDRAIDILKSFHEYNNKVFNSQDTSLVGGMIGIATLGNEFGVIENLIEDSDPEQIKKIQEIYRVPYGIQKNQLNAWKGEFYFFEHVLTGRGKSIKQVAIPYLFNGEDMINRAIILLYAGAIAEVQNNTTLLQKIHENKIINNEMFLTPAELSFRGEGSHTWKSSNILFARFYNPIGKILSDSMLRSYISYLRRYHNTTIYQDYIRYDILGIEKK